MNQSILMYLRILTRLGLSVRNGHLPPRCEVRLVLRSTVHRGAPDRRGRGRPYRGWVHQLRVSFTMLEFRDLASSNNESRHVSLGFIADAPALDAYVEEGFGAEVSYIPGGRFQYGRLDERSKHSRTVS